MPRRRAYLTPGAAWLLLRAGMAGPLRLQHDGCWAHGLGCENHAEKKGGSMGIPLDRWMVDFMENPSIFMDDWKVTLF